MKSNEHLVLVPFGLYIVTSIAIVSVILSLGYIFNRLYFISTTQDSLIHNIIETKYTITKAHLIVEEMGTVGFNRGDIERVQDLLDEARKRIHAMLDFQTQPYTSSYPRITYAAEPSNIISNHNSLKPLSARPNRLFPFQGLSNSSTLLNSLYEIKMNLENDQIPVFKSILVNSLAMPSIEKHEELDRNYTIFMRKLNDTEHLFLSSRERNVTQLKIIKTFLLIASVIMALFFSMMFFRFERRRAIDLIDSNKRTDELRNSEERYRSLYKNTPAMLHSIDQDGRIVSVSNTWLERLGYEREEVVGKKSIDFLTDESRRHANEKVWPDFFREGNVKNIEYQYVKKDGELLDVLESATVEKDKDGKFIHSLTVLHDVSELHRLQKELDQSQKMEAIGTMAGGIAHDFNNILAIIIGNLEIALRNIPSDSRAVHFIEQVANAAHRAKDIVKQILVFSRQTEQEFVPVKACLMIEESLRLLRSTTPATITISENCYDNKSSIMADPTQFHQVLMNIFSNAVHAMDEQGVIEMTVEQSNLNKEDLSEQSHCQAGQYLKLSVRDSGVGMDKRTLDCIFTPYFTTKKKGEGTGIGLAIVKKIIQSHGGFLAVESELGKGTVFHLFFPVVEVEEKLERTFVKQLPRGNNESVLYIDDEASLAELGRVMLEDYGYRVTVKTCSLDALESFKADPDKFDLVVTDQTMPHFTGTELSIEFLKIKPTLPIILCTGYSHKISEEKALELGIRKYFTKPLDMQYFLQMVRQVLDEKSNEKCSVN